MAFLLGFLLNVIKSGSRVPLLRVIYIMLSAQLAFSFWRDAFAFSFVKGMLEFSILIPVFICASSNVLSGLARRKNLELPEAMKSSPGDRCGASYGGTLMRCAKRIAFIATYGRGDAIRFRSRIVGPGALRLEIV